MYRYGRTPFYYLCFERVLHKIKIQAPASSWRRPNDDAAYSPLSRDASILVFSVRAVMSPPHLVEVWQQPFHSEECVILGRHVPLARATG